MALITIANGPGNLPDATQFMANFNALLGGLFQIGAGAPTQISSNMSVVGLAFLSNAGATALTIQGFAGGIAGQPIWFINDSTTNSVTFVHNGSGTQKFYLPGSANLVVGPRGGAMFLFDNAASVWTCVSAAGSIPIITAGQIVGTATNDSASTGNIGEYISAVISTATSFPATGVIGDLTSISLTAGDWDVCYLFYTSLNLATASDFATGIGTVAGNNFTGVVVGGNRADGAFSGAGNISVSVPPNRYSLSSTTTLYLKFTADYTAGTPKCFGGINARRAR